MQLLLKVFVFTPAGMVLDGQNNNLVVDSIDSIINEVGVFSGDELTYVSDCLPPAEFRN